MKIQILSDTHFEFHADAGKSFLDKLDPSGVDVLVFAGDLTLGDRLEMPLKRLCELYPHVVYITGNHEYYQSEPKKVHKVLYKLSQKLQNLHWLQEQTCEITGVKFAGTTLWFPDQSDNSKYQHMLNDFSLIRNFKPWVYETHAVARKCLAKAIADKVDVVVTHHIPTYTHVSREYHGSILNRFFVGDVKDLLVEGAMPKLWIYGHTHTPQDVTDRGMRVVCNPFGYPFDTKSKFREKLVLDIQPG